MILIIYIITVVLSVLMFRYAYVLDECNPIGLELFISVIPVCNILLAIIILLKTITDEVDINWDKILRIKR